MLSFIKKRMFYKLFKLLNKKEEIDDGKCLKLLFFNYLMVRFW